MISWHTVVELHVYMYTCTYVGACLHTGLPYMDMLGLLALARDQMLFTALHFPGGSEKLPVRLLAYYMYMCTSYC